MINEVSNLTYQYSKRKDWCETLRVLQVGDRRLADLTDSEYTLFAFARKNLKKEGKVYTFKKLYDDRYLISRIS